MVARELLLADPVLLAHALTLSRIPLAVLFWMTYGDPAWSIALVAVAALTDALDGTVARWAMRRSGATRSAGEWLDPLADKVFVIGVLAAIQLHDPAPWGLIALIAARELVLIPLAAAYRLVVPARMPHAFEAGAIGKAATIAELAALAALIVRSSLALPLAVAAAALGLTAVVAYVTLEASAPGRSLRSLPRHDDLEQLRLARAEAAGTRQQVVLPDPVERLAVARLEPRPRFVEVLPPRHQRRIVVLADASVFG